MKRKSPAGMATSALITSTHIGRNAGIFPSMLDLHVPRGATVADVTYGMGAFWRDVETDAYNVLATDIKSGTDCRNLPYEDGSIDAVVLDPPYMEGFYRETNRAGTGTHSALSVRYSNGNEGATTSQHRHQAAVLNFYFEACEEAARVLRVGGVLIVKCQDAVSGGKQHLTHVDLVNHLRAKGMYAKDLFVVVREGRPSVSRIVTQVHARKSHSYFLVFIKGAS